MNCGNCGRVNRDGSRFCVGCGNPLARRCPGCGEETEPDASFCGSCGSPLAATPARHSPAPAAAAHGAPAFASASAERTVARKVVTIIFADLAGSTALHERLDAESARRVMDGYYAALHSVVADHGGTVVKLLGDGVMAAFGVPRVAEDDAVRAVRAAVVMQEAFRELMREQAAVLGAVGLRVAVNTGEVIVSGDHDDVVGDPVNVAARLQQEAQDGDVLIGEATQRLVANLVTLEDFGTLALKGRSESVSAYRVVSLERPAGARTLAFVGRDDELRRVRSVYEAAVAARAARLVVVLGSPGLGKSRLINELARRLADEATIVSAQCDATGGSTFAPLVEALRTLLDLEDGAGGDVVRAAIEARLPGEAADKARVAGGVAALLAGSAASPEETFFVVRRFLSAVAATQPLVLAFDDLQWAEPLLLDLVEHLVQWSTDVPLLVLAAARPELRDARSSLTVPGGLVSGVVTLAGLDAVAATRLAANAIGADELPAAVAGRVLASSEGNPLFVGELVRMLVHDGALRREGDRWVAGADLATLEMPPTIQALLAARIERLHPQDCMVLERAAVVGRQFSRAAVAHLLASASGDLDARLESLRRSELIEPDSGWFLGEPALRFHHGLIRDAAYRRVLKGTRAELHERFADWLQGRVGDSIDHDEALGWHLEQAHQHLRELGPIGERARGIGERASGHLAAAGRRALERDDLSLASSLLGRAVDRLDVDDSARADLALDWCEALLSAGDVGPAATAVAELGRFTAGSARLGAWHTCFAGQLAVLTDPATLRETADSLAKAAEVLASIGDTAGEAKAHATRATALGRLGEVGAAEAALDLALAAARRVGDRRRAQAVLSGAPTAALWGPSPVTRASGRCLDVVRVLRITQGAPAVEAVALRCQAVLEALRGRSEAARRMIATSRDMVEELGITQRLLEAEVFAGIIEWIEGDAAAAEQRLRPAYEGLRHHGLGIDAAQAAALLGRTLLAQGRAAEAETLSHESEALAGDDLKAAIAWRGVRAEALARRGEHAAAISLAQAAVEMAARTDALLDHADARLALAAALRADGKAAEADAEEARAISLWESKGATVLAGRAHRDDGGTQAGAGPEAPAESRASVRRRLRSNAAAANFARYTELFNLRDSDGLAELQSAGDYVGVHHPTGATYGAREAAAGTRSIFRSQGCYFAGEPLVTLGDELVLGRTLFRAEHAEGKKFDVGPHENEGLHLVEVDSQGKRRRLEIFQGDRLGDAVTRLYERRAELLPDGPDRVRAEGAVKTVAASAGDFDFERVVDRASPTIVAVDHRSVGYGTLHGAEEFLRALQALLEMADEYEWRTEDILAATDSGALLRNVSFGVLKLGGGAFERHAIWLVGFAADGGIERFEQFDLGHEHDAFARFEELLGDGDGDPTEAAQTKPFANAAWDSWRRTLATIARHDWDGMDALVSQDYRVSDRRKSVQLELDRPRGLQFTRHLLEGAQFHLPPGTMLATRGERLVLTQQAVVVTAGNEGQVGPSEIEYLSVFEIDEGGAPVAWVRFDLDDLDAAWAEMERRYEAGEASANPQVLAALHSMALALSRRDWEAMAVCLAPDFAFEDHRLLGFGTSLPDAAGFIRAQQSLVELAPDARHRADHGRLGERGWLRAITNAGTVEGGAFENVFVVVAELDERHRVIRWDVYDLDRFDDAERRFEQIVKGGEPGAGLLAREAPAGEACARMLAAERTPNAATAAMDRFHAAFVARDWVAARAELGPNCGYEDRRRQVLLERDDAEPWFEGLIAGATGKLNTRFERTVIGTAGERVALERQLWTNGPADAPMEIESLFLVEVDEQGRIADTVAFSVEDEADAKTEARARWCAHDAKAAAGLGPLARDLERSPSPDLQGMRSRFHEDVVVEDHRRTGFGRLDGIEAYRDSLVVLSQLSPDARFETPTRPLEWDWYGAVIPLRMVGTLADGGAFESEYILVGITVAGLWARCETFEPEHVEEALARFRALRPNLLEIPPNAATRAFERGLRFADAQDWDALRELYAPVVMDDRRPLVGGPGDCETIVANARLIRHGDTRWTRSVLATAGDRVVLYRNVISTGPVSHPSGIETLSVIEVDADGHVTGYIIFDPKDRAAASLELAERGFAHGVGPKRYREVIRAMRHHDIAAFRAALPDGFHFNDRRRTGIGLFSDKDEYANSVAALIQEAPDVIVGEVLHVLAMDAGRQISVGHNFGTLASGGEFETVYLNVSSWSGLEVLTDLFELDDIDAAWARYDEFGKAEG